MRAFLALLAALFLAVPAAAQLGAGERHIDVRLVGGVEGTRGTLVLMMRPEPGWHGYWLNPGDAGQPTTATWQLPAGASAGALRYPVPERLLISGLMNYVYERDYALVADLTLARPLAPGDTLPVRASLRYLACTDKICVPQSAEVSAAIGAGVPREVAAARQALPRPLGTPARFAAANGKVRIGIPLPAAIPVADAYFYPASEGALTYAAPQRATRNGDWLIVETEAGPQPPAALDGVIALSRGQGFSVSAAPGPVPAAGTPLGTHATSGAGGVGAILLALGGALLGGLLLNVMPCVFPILSLKALSLARAGESGRAARIEGLAYTAGVVLVCVALGAILLALRAGGTAAGWAFQLQDPRVTLFLLLLIGGLALNLAGLFELPAFGGGEGLAARGGALGAFWTGALAAFVATPCTGPFMGAALGAALVLPAVAGLAVFAGLGLGLALPFLALGFIPALRRRLPRPGPWMARLRLILAVPMALTALWLGWLLWREAGEGALLVGLAALLLLGLGLWWGGRRGGWLGAIPAAAVAAAALLLVPATPVVRAEGGTLAAAKFSEARLAQLRAERRPVFVYFTADWCLTCKVNEKAVLDRAEVAAIFRRRNVAVLVGDWTRGDAEIGRFLEQQGRSGVPLYLWYAPGKEAQVLPQVLTVGAVAGLGS
jgi:DsbC/DsbD-like thiol-disulfide interchange protein/cytochrome c biogenesis protein CcdA